MFARYQNILVNIAEHYRASSSIIKHHRTLHCIIKHLANFIEVIDISREYHRATRELFANLTRFLLDYQHIARILFSISRASSTSSTLSNTMQYLANFTHFFLDSSTSSTYRKHHTISREYLAHFVTVFWIINYHRLSSIIIEVIRACSRMFAHIISYCKTLSSNSRTSRSVSSSFAHYQHVSTKWAVVRNHSLRSWPR
jgi:hypothetical protein